MTGTEQAPRDTYRAQHSPSVGTDSVLRLHWSSGFEMVSQVHEQWLCSEKARVMPGPWEMFQHWGWGGAEGNFSCSPINPPIGIQSQAWGEPLTDSLICDSWYRLWSKSSENPHLWPWPEQKDKERELKNHGPIGTRRPSSAVKET